MMATERFRSPLLASPLADIYIHLNRVCGGAALACSDQRHLEIHHAHTSDSYRFRLQFRLDRRRVIRGIDLAGKTAIVTGGYSGLGRETARELRAAGARVIVPARDVHRSAAALTGIDVEIESMDLLDPLTIDAFAERFLTSAQPVHILVNGAGIMANPLTRDGRGYESRFATNHLGHFQLNVRLWPALIKAKGARLVSVSSWGHHFSSVVFDDPNFERRNYDPWTAYGQSKTANVLSRSRWMSWASEMVCGPSHFIRGIFPVLASTRMFQTRNRRLPV